MKYREKLEANGIATHYSWITVGEDLSDLPDKKHIAMIATSGGVAWNGANKAKFLKRVEHLNALGFVVHVAQYEDGSWIFEPGEKVAAAVGAGTTSRAVSPQAGVTQIIECAENGWDVFPYMGGMGFVDKVAAVTEYFGREDVTRLARPIRFFNFSDCTYAAFLQSHHPDIFRFYATTTSGDLWFDPVPAGAPAREEYDEIRSRNIEDLKRILKSGEVESYPRNVLYSESSEVSLGNVQYFPLHTDMIWHDAVDFDPAKVGGAGEGRMGTLRLGYRLLDDVRFTKLNTSRPYILGCEGFLQQAGADNKYDSQFPSHLEEFLRQRAALDQLPQAVEMGLFETRLDGSNGYAFGAFRLHDEERGLIKIDDFNIDRLFTHREAIKKQISEIIKTEAVADSEAASSNVVTKIPENVKEKILRGGELDKKDIAEILECENEKILAMQASLLEVCKKYKVPLITNCRSGHCLNIGAVGGGVVNFKIKGDKAEIEQLPNEHLVNLGLKVLSTEGLKSSLCLKEI